MKIELEVKDIKPKVSSLTLNSGRRTVGRVSFHIQFKNNIKTYFTLNRKDALKLKRNIEKVFREEKNPSYRDIK